MNDSTTLNGPLLSISINDNGNLLAIMESRTLSIDLPQGKDEYLRNNIIQTNDEFYKSDYWKNDTSHLVVRNAWWIPSVNIGDTECILLLSSNNRWHVYERKCVKSQWGSSGQKFSPDLKKFQTANNSFRFIDLFISQRISYDGKMDQSTQKIESATFQSYFAPWDKVVSIDSSNFPEDFFLGVFDNSIKSPKKRFFKNKLKIRKNLNIDEGTSRDEVSTLSNGKSRTDTYADNSANGAVIKQITKVSSSGEKRLITYLMDGKDTEVEVSGEHEEKVHCVCGATEEDSSADEEWVECDLCHTWQHVECVAYFPEVQDFFHCDNCLKKDKNVKPKQKFTKKGKKMGRPRKPKEPACLTETGGRNNLQMSPVQQGSGGLKNDILSDEANKLSSDSSEILCSDGVKNAQVDDHVSDCSSNHGIAHEGSHINCPCGASESESGEEWVQCDSCDKWQHQECVNYGTEDQQNYKCPSCKKICLFFSHHYKPKLAVEQSATMSSKFRIPKIPKIREDEFEEVGRSNCQQNISTCAPIQPIYIPKCCSMAFDQGMRHAAVGSNEPRVGDNNDSSLAKLSPKSIRPTGTSSDHKLDPRASDDESETVSTRNIVGSMVRCHATQDIQFIFMLYNKALVILHSFDRTYQISAIHSFSKYEMSLMSVYSNADEPGTYSVATVDCLSNDIVLLDFGFTDCRSESIESEDFQVLRYPSMSLVSTRTIPSGDGVFIEKLMWASQDKLVVFKQESMFCYDVLKLQLLWTMIHGLAFLSDSHLDSDMNIVLFDAYGEEIVIDIRNGEQLSRCKSVMETNEQLVTTSISPSGLMKVQAKVMCQSALQFNSPVTLTFSSYLPLDNIDSAEQHSYEFLFLQGISQKGHIMSDYEITTQPITPGASCPICSSTELARTEEPLEVGCPQSHVSYRDPTTGEVLDPFEMVECGWCGTFNKLNTRNVCGKCKKVLIMIS